MAKLSKRTLQRLAVLRALLLWRRGAYGALRVHKTLFFSEEKHGSQRFFDFKRWHYGQFSDEIENSLNDLSHSGRMNLVFDGACVRLVPNLAGDLQATIERLFEVHFSAWNIALLETQDLQGYWINDQILEEAHRHQSHLSSVPGQIIAKATIGEYVEINIDEDEAESLSESVDPHFTRILKRQMDKACAEPFEAEDWRAIYFADEPPVSK